MEWLSHLTVPNVATAIAVITLTNIIWQVSAPTLDILLMSAHIQSKVSVTD